MDREVEPQALLGDILRLLLQVLVRSASDRADAAEAVRKSVETPVIKRAPPTPATLHTNFYCKPALMLGHLTISLV
jgi:hypothetical protein